MSYFFEEVAKQLQEATPLYGEVDRTLRFLVDVQLPKRLSDFLRSKGYASIHTLELPDKNASTDSFIKEKVHNEGLVLITKDDDFLRSFFVEKKPQKLILVKTGNISNSELIDIFDRGGDVIMSLIGSHRLVEINRKQIVVHN